MKQLITRIALIVIFAGAAGVLAFGPRAVGSGPTDRVRIQYWEHWNGLEAEQMKSIVDAFNDTVGKDKGIWVDFSSISQVERKTLIATAAGVPPDVAGLWDSQVRQFAAMDALEPLDKYATEYGLTADKYKPVYYDGCSYRGTLYALPSTPWVTALHYHKGVFRKKADALRAANLDPERAPATLAELDVYAAAIDTWEQRGGRRKLASAGFVPLEPQSFINYTGYWFGAEIIDPSRTRLLLDAPAMKRAYDWIRGYTEKVGKEQMIELRSGFGDFDSPQNAFLTGSVAMTMSGPWMSSFIEKLNPRMNRHGVSEAELDRERAFAGIRPGMSQSEIEQTLCDPGHVDGNVRSWVAGIKLLRVQFADDRAIQVEIKLRPIEERRNMCEWAAAPFPSAMPGVQRVGYAGMDVLVIPRGSKHKKEAFEFIAFVNRQDQMERLCSMHCKNSPLIAVSEQFYNEHPNPYVRVFDEIAASPNVRSLPAVPNWPEVNDELGQVAQKAHLMEAATDEILQEVQARSQRKLDRFLARQDARRKQLR